MPSTFPPCTAVPRKFSHCNEKWHSSVVLLYGDDNEGRHFQDTVARVETRRSKQRHWRHWFRWQHPKDCNAEAQPTHLTFIAIRHNHALWMRYGPVQVTGKECKQNIHAEGKRFGWKRQEKTLKPVNSLARSPHTESSPKFSEEVKRTNLVVLSSAILLTFL